MARLDDSDFLELEQALGNLSANPRVPPSYRLRLDDLRRAAGARRSVEEDVALTDRDLDRFEIVMTRLHTAVQGKKKELELQLRQYDKREKRLAEVLEAIDEKRKEREKAASAKSRSRSSREARSGEAG